MPTLIEPTLEEFWSTSVKVSQPYFFQSWMVALAIVIAPFSPKIRSVGRTTPSSSAEAAMITLKVEPGSNGSVTARTRRSSSVAVAKAFGL